MLTTIGHVPKQSTTLYRGSNLERPGLKFICKMRKDGVFTAMLFLEEQLLFFQIFGVGAGSALQVRNWWWE